MDCEHVCLIPNMLRRQDGLSVQGGQGGQGGLSGRRPGLSTAGAPRLRASTNYPLNYDAGSSALAGTSCGLGASRLRACLFGSRHSAVQ